MPITDRHPEYQAMAARWQRCRDVADGSDAVKAAGTAYLPRPSGMDPFDNSYPAYLGRALFYNAMSRTIDGLAGAILQKAPTVTVPDRVKPLLTDITLADQSLELLAAEVLREVLAVGRYAVLVDYSATSARPFMAPYPAESLVSWRTERRDGDAVLVRAVLREWVEEPDPADESKITGRDQYRELVLSPEGYVVRVHTKLPRSHLRDPARDVWVATDWLTPTRRGKALPFIPLVVVGAHGLGAHVTRPPLVDLADVNLSHYRSSADREHSLHYVSLPTPWVAGARGDGPLKIGSSVAWSLEKDGKAGMLEHSGEGIGAIKAAMDEKVQLMASLGARLLEQQPQAAETATAVGMRHAGEHASLRAIAESVSAGLTMALRWCTWWDGIETNPANVKASVELNKDFFAVRMTAEELKAHVLAWQADALSWETLHRNLTRGDVMRPGVTADEERRAIQHQGGPPRAAVDDDEGDAA